MAIYAGYINLKPINGVIFPSYVQNQINKNYITTKLNGEFFLSTNENTYGTNNIVLRSLVDEKRIKGISLLSTFALPNQLTDRIELYKILLKKKKELHFVFEEIKLIKKKDIDKVEEFLLFNNEFFTKKKTNLNKLEKLWFKNKSWNFV